MRAQSLLWETARSSGMKIAHLWVFDRTTVVNNELFDIQAYLSKGGWYVEEALTAREV